MTHSFQNQYVAMILQRLPDHAIHCLAWFVGLNLDEEVWDATTFPKNRDRLL